MDDLEALGERIATLSAQIQAATYQLLVMIREFDAREGWGCGFRSCAHWLNWRTGLAFGAAREKVRVARALAALPVIAAAMERGELSFSKVRALTRVATPATEAELLIFAKAGTAAHVETLVRSWRRVDRLAEMEQEQRQFASRYLRIHTDEDGMVIVQARLAPLSRSLDEESTRHVREHLSDEELVVFDLLTRPGPELSTAEREEVKKVARQILARLRSVLALDWQKTAQARARVRETIDETLDDGLPRVYTPDVFRAKSAVVFQHVYERYGRAA